LFLVGIAGDPVSDVAQAVAAYHFGSLLSAGNLTAGIAELHQLTRAYQSLASSRATGRAGFFIAANQEGGEVQSLQGPGFPAIPPALTQGSLSSSVLERQAAVWGGELRSAGFNLDLAPVMDVVPAGTADRNQPIGMLEREFGYSPATVAAHGARSSGGCSRQESRPPPSIPGAGPGSRQHRFHRRSRGQRDRAA
jgi:beta-N-acetylhexosaminidase